MKNSFSLMLLAGATALFSFTSCEKDEDVILGAGETPVGITSFADTHFPNNSITQAVKETDDGVVTYDVTLQDGIELEFNEDKSIVGIDSNSGLPQSFLDAVVLPEMVSYVNTNYATQVITDWELESNEYQIVLDNDVDLIFGLNGNFLRIDN